VAEEAGKRQNAAYLSFDFSGRRPVECQTTVVSETQSKVVSGGQAMTILDFREQREARRRAEWDRWCASQERDLEKIRRILDAWAPMFDQLLAQNARMRRPRCEAPGCWNTITTLRPVPGRTSDHSPALVRLCATHMLAVRNGRFRVTADDADSLLWHLYDPGTTTPLARIKLPRRRASRRARGDPPATVSPAIGAGAAPSGSGD
jgi:hypothetical protein